MRRSAPSKMQEKWLVRLARIVAWVFGGLYGLQLVRRIVFMIIEGGMEKSDGTGSPLAFLIGMIGEFIFLGIPALLLAGLVRCQTQKEEPNQASAPMLPGGPFSPTASTPKPRSPIVMSVTHF